MTTLSNLSPNIHNAVPLPGLTVPAAAAVTLIMVKPDWQGNGKTMPIVSHITPFGTGMPGWISFSPHWKSTGQLMPQFIPANNGFLPPTAGFPLFPIKPLPGVSGGGGGGAGTIGTGY